MNCLYCGQKLTSDRNPELGSFCSAEHERKFGVDIRVLLQLQNPGRLEIPRPEPTASSNCLYCAQPLSIRKRLKGWQFCNSNHEDLYYRQWNEQAMARLGGAAALEDDLYGVDLTESDPEAIPCCQFCGEPLSVGRRLKRRRFCSEEHEEQYRRQQSTLLFSRLRADDRPRARPRRLWDPRNTEGCAGFEPMPAPPKPGRLTLYPAEGIQFSVSPSILRFGGEILKLASGGAVARPRLRGLTLGRREVVAAGAVDLRIAVPPRPAGIHHLGEPAAEPARNLIMLPGSAGCVAIRDDLAQEAFVTPELLRPPLDAGFLDYPRTQIPERFRRPLWMPRMAVRSLGPTVVERTESRLEAESRKSAVDRPVAAGPLAEEPRWGEAPVPSAPAFREAWIGGVETPLLPRPAGAPVGGRLGGVECFRPRVRARIAGERVPGWASGNAGEVKMADGTWVRRYSTPPALRPSGPASRRVGASAKDRAHPGRKEAFSDSGFREAILPGWGAGLPGVSLGAAGFRVLCRASEFFTLRGTAAEFPAGSARVAVPGIVAWRGGVSLRGGAYSDPLPAVSRAVREAQAGAWKSGTVRVPIVPGAEAVAAPEIAVWGERDWGEKELMRPGARAAAPPPSRVEADEWRVGTAQVRTMLDSAAVAAPGIPASRDELLLCSGAYSGPPPAAPAPARQTGAAEWNPGQPRVVSMKLDGGAVAAPKIGVWGDGALRRTGAYCTPPGLPPLGRVEAAEWNIGPAPIYVRRAPSWRAEAGIGSAPLVGLLYAARSTRRYESRQQAWLARGAEIRTDYPSLPESPFAGKPAGSGYLMVTPAGGGHLAAPVSGAPPDNWKMETAGPQIPAANVALRNAGTVVPAPVLPFGGREPAGIVLGNGRLWVVNGESRFAGSERVEMPGPLVGGGLTLPLRAERRMGEWAARAGGRVMQSAEWREQLNGGPLLPGRGALLINVRPGMAGAREWRSGVYGSEGASRELAFAYRFVFPAAVAAELEQLPARQRAARGKIVVLR